MKKKPHRRKFMEIHTQEFELLDVAHIIFRWVMCINI